MYLVIAIIFLVVLILLAKDSSRGRLVGAPSAANTTLSTKAYIGATKTLTGGIRGVKKALLFGLNYTGQPSQLYGCITDVQNLRTFLMSKGFSVELYSDSTPQKPTGAIILAKVAAFAQSLKATDCGFIWYSGHGILVSGRNAWVPLDYALTGFLTEDRIRTALTIKTGTRIFMGSDSCFSGSLLDLKYDVEANGSTTSIRGGALVARSLAARLQSHQSNQSHEGETVPKTLNVERLVPIEMPEPHTPEVIQRAAAVQNYTLYDISKFVSTAYDIVYISGCRDNQTSADTYEAGQSQGAMTWAFLKAVRSMSAAAGSLGLMQDLMRLGLAGRYAQVPQLSFGLPLNANISIKEFGLI